MKEDEKLDIEDIKDPEDYEDLDLEEVVSENEEIGEETESEREKKTDSQSAKEVQAQPKQEKPKAKNNQFKLIIIVATALLVIVAVIMGTIYFLQKNNAEVADITGTTNKTEETGGGGDDSEEEQLEKSESLYISSEVGLNLREFPDTKSKVLVIIPYGTKVEVLGRQSGWAKTTYDLKTGWISEDFTQTTDPLTYKNETYGFGFTFKPGWAGYKFFEANNTSGTAVKNYYVALPTTDKNWNETGSGIPKGYASLFVMGIYTKTEWAKLAGGEILPAKLGESEKYIYTYLPGQAYATDLKTQYDEIRDIIKSFEAL